MGLLDDMKGLLAQYASGGTPLVSQLFSSGSPEASSTE